MARILVVDDEKSIRNTLSEFIMEEGHEVLTAEDAEQAFRFLGENRLDVVVTDIILPRITGVDLLNRIHEVEPSVQVIMITGEPTVDTAAAAVRTGAFDYLSKPISRDEIKAVIASAVRVKELADERERLEAENLRYREHLEEEVAKKTEALRESEEKYRRVVENADEAVFIAQGSVLRFVNPKTCEVTGYSAERLLSIPFVDLIHPEDREMVLDRYKRRLAGHDVPSVYEFRIIDARGETKWIEIRPVLIEWEDSPASLNLASDVTKRKQAEAALHAALQGTIEAIGLTTETRDPYTAGHQRRVTELAGAIAAELGLETERIEGIRAAGLMHDIGKMAIPAEILSKPSALNDMEMVLIQSHPRVAYDILKAISFPWPLAQIVLQHHERIDGSGYPEGLRNDEILLEARILAVADTVEAMASHRPYRAALGIDVALEEIEAKMGACYDPDVAEACLMLFREGRFAFDDAASRSG